MESIDLNKLYLNVAISSAELKKEEEIYSIITAYEMWYAGVIAGIISIDEIINISDILGTDNPTDNESLLHLSKAGSYLRYAIEYGNLDFDNPTTEEFANAFYELIDRKNDEDSPTDEAMKEIDELMKETDELMDEIDIEDSEDKSED